MPESDIIEEAKRLLNLANEKGIMLRLLGGLAIRLQCPSAESAPYQREYKDIDVVGPSKATTDIQSMFVEAGYLPDKTFNALHGHQRLYFWDSDNERQVDVFLDRMELCHKVEFRDRLKIDPRTLPLADLLLTKLQVVEVNHKDLTDALAIFKDHSLEPNDGAINVRHITSKLSEDWGFWRTFTHNLEKLRVLALDKDNDPTALGRIDALEAAIERAPKSMKWKLRSKVGERVRWYDLPEEEQHG